MVYKPKELPEDINVTPVHPLVNFAYLLGTVVVFSAVVYLILGAIATRLVARISPEMESELPNTDTLRGTVWASKFIGNSNKRCRAVLGVSPMSYCIKNS